MLGIRRCGRRQCLEPTALQLQEANAQLAEQACPHDVEMTPVQRRIEPRSADDSLSGVVRCLYFADTFLRDGEARGGLGVGENGPQSASRKWAVVVAGDHIFQKGGKHYWAGDRVLGCADNPCRISDGKGLMGEPARTSETQGWGECGICQGQGPEVSPRSV